MMVKKRKIFAGLGWVALIRYSNKAFGFITTLILAKLLAPEDFGIVAVASMIIQVIHLLKDMGLSQALIYRHGNIEEAATTAFWMILLLNLMIFLLAVAISPLAGRFYDNPHIMPVLILLSTNVVWNSIRAVPTALIRKEIKFSKFILPDVVPVFFASVISIVLAFKGFGVWSLVIRNLIVSLGGMSLIWCVSPFRPRLAFNKQFALELLNYGKYIVGSSIFFVILYNIDKLYVSKFGTVAMLGFYELAMRIANLPVSEFSHLIGSVMFPVLSKLNQNHEEFLKVFHKTIRYSAFISIPMAIGISTYGPVFIELLYGDKWLPMALPLQIVSIYALFRSLSTIIHDTFKSVGRPKLMQQFVIARLVLIGILGIPALQYFGLVGICSLVVSTYLLVLLLEIRCVCNLLDISAIEISKSLISISLVSITAIYSTYFIIIALIGFFNFYTMIGAILLTIILYFLILINIDRVILSDIRKIVSCSR